MSYSITTSTYQTNSTANVFFQLVEKTIWNFANGGTWTNANNQDILTMGGSGTSGIVRFLSLNGTENFAVVLGVHNYARWCDIVTDIPSTTTATTLQPLYYGSGTPQSAQREKQSSTCTATAQNGRKIDVIYTVASGNALAANIVIG